MTTYYLDTSALSKRYVEETGSNWVRTLVLPEAEHTLLTARITMVEIYSALARRKRVSYPLFLKSRSNKKKKVYGSTTV
jgi:hypothetical protein